MNNPYEGGFASQSGASFSLHTTIRFPFVKISLLFFEGEIRTGMKTKILMQSMNYRYYYNTASFLNSIASEIISRSRVSELTDFIDKAKEQTLNTESFLRLVRKFTDIQELDAEIIRTFVEKIEVYQPE